MLTDDKGDFSEMDKLKVFLESANRLRDIFRKEAAGENFGGIPAEFESVMNLTVAAFETQIRQQQEIDALKETVRQLKK